MVLCAIKCLCVHASTKYACASLFLLLLAPTACLCGCHFCCHLVHALHVSDWEASRRLLPPLASSLAYSNYSSWQAQHEGQDLPQVAPGVSIPDLYKAAEREVRRHMLHTCIADACLHVLRIKLEQCSGSSLSMLQAGAAVKPLLLWCFTSACL
jgi:hypothetical protein